MRLLTVATQAFSARLLLFLEPAAGTFLEPGLNAVSGPADIGREHTGGHEAGPDGEVPG